MRYHVTAAITISLSCEVEASSEAEALAKAADLPLVQIYEGGQEDDLDMWHTSGELDGEPFDLEVEVAK